MRYIWINPVTAAMYDPAQLDQFLQKHDYKQYISNTNWAGVVREKYRRLVKQSKGTVIDVRCPKIKELFLEYGLEKAGKIILPDIDPILIHYGREASYESEAEWEEDYKSEAEWEASNEADAEQEVGLVAEQKNGIGCIRNRKLRELLITTPCQALADMGNELSLPGIRFLPWNTFLMEHEGEPKRRNLKKSPIPPGFFDELRLNTVSLSGEEEIRNYLVHFVSGEEQLVEMLYCKGGCHNGDGIVKVGAGYTTDIGHLI